MSAVKKLLSLADEEESVLAAKVAESRHALAVIEAALADVRSARDVRISLGEETTPERGTIASLVAEAEALREELEAAELLHAAAVSKAGKDREEARKAELRAEAASIVEKVRAIREEILPALDGLALAAEEDARHVGRVRMIADALPGEAVPRLSSVNDLSGPVALSFRVRDLAADLRRLRV